MQVLPIDQMDDGFKRPASIRSNPSELEERLKKLIFCERRLGWAAESSPKTDNDSPKQSLRQIYGLAQQSYCLRLNR